MSQKLITLNLKSSPVTLKKKTTAKIIQEIIRVVDRVIQTRTVSEPFDIEQLRKERPFHVALLPEEILKSSKFERSFVTSMGSIWESIARIIVEEEWGFSENGYDVSGQIYQNQLKVIQRILNDLEHGGKRSPNWNSEIKEVLAAASGPKVNSTVVVDLFGRTDKGKTLYCEIKASKPNSDQSKVSKEKMLKIFAMQHKEKPLIFFAFPDNPYGTKAKYNWPYPKRFFDMNTGPEVIMGRDFWELLGGKGTYRDLVKAFEEAGKVTKPKIRDEYLHK